MEEMELLAPLAFVIISLIAGALLKLVLTKINLPYTVGLFVLGMIVGVLNMNGFLISTPVISESITLVCNIDPDLILNIFLPILIFSAAYELDVHIFKKTLFNATLLAVPGMVIAMFLTAALMMGVTYFAPAYSSWNWTFALMFGALISATDPVAVVALLGELGVSKRFSTLIDGESLLNDGTGIVLFMLMYAPFASTVDMADSSPVISFLVVVFGGLLIGYLMARAFLYYVTRSGVKGDALLQTSVMILLSYITFILAQDIFKLSGVIALVAFGLVLAYHGSSKLESSAQHFMKEFWALLSYIANTLIFIIIGIIIAEKVDFVWTDLVVLLIVYVGINLVRMAMITLLYPLLKRSGYGLSKREGWILTWGALRGALALTLALMVSYTDSIPEDIRRQILLLTAGIVALTLIVNATTIKWMLSKLGLLTESASRKLMAAEVRSKLRQKSCDYIGSLQQDDTFKGADWAQISGRLPKLEEQPMESPTNPDLVAELRMKIISGERQVLHTMFVGGEIAIEAQRKLIAALDALVDKNGYIPLDERIKALGLDESVNKESSPLFRSNKFLRLLSLRYMITPPIERYEVAFGVFKAQQRASEIAGELSTNKTLSESQLSELQVLQDEVNNIKEAALSFIDKFAGEYPEDYREALTLRAQRMLSHFERESIEELVMSGEIDADSAEVLQKEIAQL